MHLLITVPMCVQECTGSICLAYGLESCQCAQAEGDSATKPCELCCKLPGETSPCLSSFQVTAHFDAKYF